jgi:VWFA-related protein
LVAAMSLLAQIPAPPIRVTTQMVEVDVVVRDKNGPVAGLLQSDFILRDRGRVQKIAVFRADSSRVATGSAAPPAPGEFTNRRGDAGAAQHAVVIVWDHLNSDFGDAAVARTQVLKALGQIQTNDRVSLYALDSELRVIQDFTSDSSALVEALRKYREEKLARPFDVPLLTIPDAGDPRVVALYEEINADLTAKSAAYRAERTAAAVRSIANYLANVQGRKSVIWIASEFPGALSALAYAGIAVYPLDIGGTSPATPQSTHIDRVIARQSGGIAFVHGNLRGAIDRAMKDSESTYTLGFYPDRAPDRINALKIEMTRKGLEVSYRNAYSGVAESDSTRGKEIAAALASPLDATAISLRVRATKQGDTWNLALELDPADVALENRDGRRTGGLDIALRQFTAEGLVLATSMTTASLEFDEARYRTFMNDKHVVNLTIPDANPSLASIRLVVADRVSGRVGSLTIPIQPHQVSPGTR